jgi:hypothetical protein
MMTSKAYFHLCSDGNETPEFIISRKDFIAAMNIVALCAANSGASVLAFTIQDTHLHLFLYGTRSDCVNFKEMFEKTFRRYVTQTRSDSNLFRLNLEIHSVGGDEQYLMNVAVYTVIQPTKDGKGILPFDYPWGSGSLYFRNSRVVPIWYSDGKGGLLSPVRFGSLSFDRKRALAHSRVHTIPDDWLVCDGIILPSNYVDVEHFQSIVKTHNCYRVFLAGSRTTEAEILKRMASERGVMLEDLDAREICGEQCKVMFGYRDPRRLDSNSKILLAQALRRNHNITIRQIAGLIRLPESEVARYVP